MRVQAEAGGGCQGFGSTGHDGLVQPGPVGWIESPPFGGCGLLQARTGPASIHTAPMQIAFLDEAFGAIRLLDRPFRAQRPGDKLIRLAHADISGGGIDSGASNAPPEDSTAK